MRVYFNIYDDGFSLSFIEYDGRKYEAALSQEVLIVSQHDEPILFLDTPEKIEASRYTDILRTIVYLNPPKFVRKDVVECEVKDAVRRLRKSLSK